jgi:hypothetical protein
MLQQSLTPYEIPRQWYFLPQFLETPTGKIDRLANVQRLATASQSFDPNVMDAEARTLVERTNQCG